MMTLISKSAGNDFSGKSGYLNAFYARADRLRESSKILLENSRDGIRWIQAFFQNISDRETFNALNKLAGTLQPGTSLDEAIDQSGLGATLQERLGRFLPEILSLVQEPDQKFFLGSAIQLALRLRKNKPEVSRAILGMLKQNATIPEAIRKEARDEFKAISGEGPLSRRAEYLLGNTVQQVVNFKTIFLMTGATALRQTVEMAVMGHLGRFSLGTRVLAGMARYGSEAALFGIGENVLNRGETPIGEDLKRSALSLGAMTLSGLAENWAVSRLGLAAAGGVRSFAKVAISQGAMFAGLYGVNLWEGKADIANVLGSMVGMQVGAHIGQSLVGPIAALPREWMLRRAHDLKYGETKVGNAEVAFASLSMRPLEATSSPGIAPPRKIEGPVIDGLPKPTAMSTEGQEGNGRPTLEETSGKDLTENLLQELIDSATRESSLIGIQKLANLVRQDARAISAMEEVYRYWHFKFPKYHPALTLSAIHAMDVNAVQQLAKLATHDPRAVFALEEVCNQNPVRDGNYTSQTPGRGLFLESLYQAFHSLDVAPYEAQLSAGTADPEILQALEILRARNNRPLRRSGRFADAP